MLVPPPPVEIANHRNLPGVGGPDGEVRSGRAVALGDMGPKLFIDAVVLPLPKEIEVVVGQEGSCRRYHGYICSSVLPFVSRTEVHTKSREIAAAAAYSP